MHALVAQLQTRALKEKLAAARQEIKDYELYKDVMETAVVRLKGEMQKLVDERESARKDASRAHGHARREREQAINARRRVKELEGELVKSQLTAEGKISRAKASVRNQEVRLAAYVRMARVVAARWVGADASHWRVVAWFSQQSLVAMRDQVLADNERLLRELQDTRDKLLGERRCVLTPCGVVCVWAWVSMQVRALTVALFPSASQSQRQARGDSGTAAGRGGAGTGDQRRADEPTGGAACRAGGRRGE